MATTVPELQRQLQQFQQIYNHERPHRSLDGRTPVQGYTALPKAGPGDVSEQEWCIRHDVVDKAGRVCIRYAGRQYHLGIGRSYSGVRVQMVVVDKHITTAVAATKQVIAEHVIDETRDYQKPLWKP